MINGTVKKIKAVKLAIVDASTYNKFNPFRELCCVTFLDPEEVLINFSQHNEITDVFASACREIRFNEDDENIDFAVVGSVSDEAFDAIIHHYQYRLGGGDELIEL